MDEIDNKCRVVGCERRGKLVRGLCCRCYRRLKMRVNCGQDKWGDFDQCTIDTVLHKNSFRVLCYHRNKRDAKRNRKNERAMIERIVRNHPDMSIRNKAEEWIEKLVSQ
jgi:hypothetical protein